jgi:hypothetical protein
MSASVSSSPSAPPLEHALRVKRVIPIFNIKVGKTRFKLKATTATVVTGAPVHYDEKLYDSFYYDRWYSITGSITQGERPTLKAREEKGIIKTRMNVPTLKIRNE